VFNFKKPKTIAFLVLAFIGIVYLLWPLLWGRVFLIDSSTSLFGGFTRRTLVCTNGTVFQDNGRNWFVNNAMALVGLLTHNQVDFDLGSGKKYVGLISKDDMKNLRSELGSAFVYSGRISPNDPDPNASGSTTRTFIVLDADDDVSMSHDGPTPARTIDKEEYKKYERLLGSTVKRGRASGYTLHFYRYAKADEWPFSSLIDLTQSNGAWIALGDLDETAREQLDGYFWPRSSRQQNILYFHSPNDISKVYWVAFYRASSNPQAHLPKEERLNIHAYQTQDIKAFAEAIGLSSQALIAAAEKTGDGTFDLPIDTPSSKVALGTLNSVDSDPRFIWSDSEGSLYHVGIGVERLTEDVMRIDCRPRS
jgi:hypothetical protein